MTRRSSFGMMSKHEQLLQIIGFRRVSLRSELGEPDFDAVSDVASKVAKASQTSCPGL